MFSDHANRQAFLAYRLRGLAMGGAVLHVGAHPDDEDVGLLSYLACKFGVRAVYWAATRGEGGQNRLNGYRDEALGIYRTWETLAARQVDGGESLFGPFYDFGYSKNAGEALAKWGRRAVVREIARAIRLVQPQIVVSRWTGTPRDEHGHHQAVGQATPEAFDAADDPDQFPELTAQGLVPWRALKLYQSTGGDWQPGQQGVTFGQLDPLLERPGVLRINTGEFDEIGGTTYQARAWAGSNQHQTQAVGFAPAPGDFFYYFVLVKSLVPVPLRETHVFEGLDPSLTGLADSTGDVFGYLRGDLEAVKARAQEALRRFRADDPREASPPLLEALALLRKLRARLAGEDPRGGRDAIDRYLARKTADFERVAAQFLGLEVECLSKRARIIPGERFRLSTRLWNHAGAKIDATRFTVSLPEGWHAVVAEAERGDEHVLDITVPETADLTCPYWLAEPREPYFYHWPEGDPCGRPFGPAAVRALCEVVIGEHRMTLEKAAAHREAFPGGFRELPVAVVPPISLQPVAGQEFIQIGPPKRRGPVRSQQELKGVLDFLEESLSARSLQLEVVASNNGGGPLQGTLELVAPAGWGISPDRVQVSLPKPGDSHIARFTVTVPFDTPEGRYSLEYQVAHGGRRYAAVVRPVRMAAPGLSAVMDGSNCVLEEFVLPPSRVTVHLINVEFSPALRYAYVEGAKEELREVLKPFGIAFHALTDSEMGHLDLSGFDAIVVAPNAYLVREELRTNAGRLLDYVKEGGTLIVQYQGYDYQNRRYTPYPFRYNEPHDRVTHEDAKVTILEPDDPVFRLPNPIGARDFDHWVRDRGLYFFSQWDARYKPLLACADSGEAPQAGGLVKCQYGRGTFVYVGYSLFRQLPSGVPGAFRLFANLLALPVARILERCEFLKTLPLFSALTAEQLDALARVAGELVVEDGAWICRPGEADLATYFVYGGEVEVLAGSSEQVPMRVAKAGDCLGELGAMRNVLRRASMRARGNAHLLVLKEAQFQSVVRQHPDISVQVIRHLLSRMADAELGLP